MSGWRDPLETHPVRRLIGLFVLVIGLSAAQENTRSERLTPAFDIVSIKPTPGGAAFRFESQCENGGRFISRGTPLLWEIKWAFDLNDYQVSENFPAWLNSFGTYDIEAKSDGNVSEKECRMMVRSLFRDRFKLSMRAETKQVSAYALVVTKRGPKFSGGGRVKINGAVKQAPSEREAPDGWTMARLSNYLANVREVSRPVVDKTGLTARYGFAFNYSTGENDDRPDIFTAVEQQLGLKLERIKVPIEMYSIDYVERPSQN